MPSASSGWRTGRPPAPEAFARALQRPTEPPVEVRETHVSWVFLTGDRAYKLKKPVRFPFVDQSTAERRRALCEEEVRVNAPLARDVVLGVRDVVAVNRSYVLAAPGTPGAVDHVVEMRRFDEGRTMAALLRNGALDAETCRRVGARLCWFHARARRVAGGGAAAIQRVVDRNFEELRPLVRDVVPHRRLLAAERLASAFLLARDDELDARAVDGRVVDGHGDLRAEHVLLEPGREPVFVDRLEFAASLRHVDVADDLAFLVMDLEALGARWAADAVVAGYRDARGDPGDDALIAFFGAYRAQVRAKVALLGGDADGARTLLTLGERLGWRARGSIVLAMSGPPASGKSTLAEAIAAASGMPLLASDVLRDDVVGVRRAGRYDDAARQRVYAELGRRARESGGGVLVDATFGDAGSRAAFRDALGPERHGDLRVVECRAPAPVLAARAAARATAGGSASEAGPDVAARLAASFTPLDEPPAVRLVVETTEAVEQQVDRVAAWLDDGLCSR